MAKPSQCRFQKPEGCLYSEDQYKRERSEKIATVLAIVLALVPWGVGMPVAYRWPLWGASLASVLYLLFTVIPQLLRFSSVQKVSASICVLSLLCFIFWPVMHTEWKSERAGMVEGELIPIGRGTAKAASFEIGNSGTILNWTPSSGNEHKEAMSLLYDAGLRLELEDGKVSLTTLVRDRQGRLVAKVEKNRWSITKECLDKNYTRDSIEILDARGLVVFQARLLPDRVQLRGEWRDEFGNGVRLVEAGENAGAVVAIWHDPKTEQAQMQIIKPIFKYPSEAHWGEGID